MFYAMDRSPAFPFSVGRRATPESPESVHRDAFRGAVEAADAYHATRAAIRVSGETVRLGNRFVRLGRYREVAFVAAGHAASSQAFAATHALGERVTQGLVLGPGPVPAEIPFRSVGVPRGPPGSPKGEEAANLAMELAGGLGERDLLILLLSPGALSSLALAPAGATASEFGGWLGRFSTAGASAREVALAAAALGRGGVNGGLATAARGAEVVTIVVERGDGGALVGGGPSHRLSGEERAELLQAVERLGESAGPLRDRLRARSDSVAALPPTVSRPVVVAGPSDALRGAADAVGEKRYFPRLAELSYPQRPEEAGAAFGARIEWILTSEPGLLRSTDRDGLVAFAAGTLGVPEGFDTRPALSTFLGTVGPILRRRGTSVAAFSTAGAESPDEPPGAFIRASVGGSARAETMRAPGVRGGITDVGCLFVAVVPTHPA